MATVEIPLKNGGVMLADAEDYELLSPIPWARMRVGRHTPIEYAYTGWLETRVYAHRLVARAIGKTEVDHINGDGLDNRRSNLRVTTHALNLANQRPQKGCSSPYKGVSWDKCHQRWHAYIKVSGRKRGLGYYRDEVDAAIAYDIAALEAWGPHARPNFEW